MRKTHKIVMLSTESISDIALFQTLDYNSQGFDPHIIDTKHLYILSDKNDDIKDEDWCYEKSTNSIIKCENELMANSFKYLKKIIASTDKSIEKRIFPFNDDAFYDTILPQINESFIKAYIKAYNEGRTIKEIQLEWESEGEKRVNGTNGFEKSYKLKVREDNTVIIHQAKTYTETDIQNMVDKALSESFENWSEDAINGYTTTMKSIIHRLNL